MRVSVFLISSRQNWRIGAFEQPELGLVDRQPDPVIIGSVFEPVGLLVTLKESGSQPFRTATWCPR